MKRLALFICTLLCANVLLAQTFWVDSLRYQVTSTNPAEVEVYDAYTSITTANIPATVSYNGTTYSVTSIKGGEYSSAFYNCSSLTTLNFNAVNCNDFNYSSSSSNPFYNCPINTINIGDSVQRIPAAFAYNLDDLTSIEISNSVTSIGDYAFGDCDGLTSVTIPNSVTSIGGGVFYSCYNLSSVTLSNNITSLPAYNDYYGFFEGCRNLTSITIPNSVTSIGIAAFYECSSLTSIDIPNSVTSIESSAFAYCNSLTSITIPNSVTSIGYHAFGGCSGLTSVTIGNSVTSIGVYAFRDCDGLTSITIPNSVTSIGEEAFRGCSDLTYIILGESVESIGKAAFASSSFLQKITCLATNPPTLFSNSFPNSNMATLTVPCGSLDAYTVSTSFWNILFNGRIEEDCTSLEDVEDTELSFYPNPTDSKITFSSTIESIEVIDLTGRCVLTFSNAREINIESLPSGAYYLRLTNNDKAIMQKIIKE